MTEVLDAFNKALRDLARPGMLWHVLWPALLAITFWGCVAFAFWANGLALMGQMIPQLPWGGWEWLANWAAAFLLVAAIATLTYFTSILLVAVIALPLMIKRIAETDYPDLVLHGENPFLGSLGNTLSAGLIFLMGGFFSLPLLLIPGAILVVPLFWTAWLNQRTFAFDALAEHATRNELKLLLKNQRLPFYAAGVGCSLLAHIPLVQLIVPVFTALVFVHFGLASLRRQRQEMGIPL